MRLSHNHHVEVHILVVTSKNCTDRTIKVSLFIVLSTCMSCNDSNLIVILLVPIYMAFISDSTCT